MSVNILFLEIEGVLTTKDLNVLTTRYINDQKLCFNSEYVKNLNNLISELDLFIVFTSSSFSSLTLEESAKIANKAGLDNTKFMDNLTIEQDENYLEAIANYLQEQRHRVDQYFILNTCKNIPPTVSKNIYIPLSGFTFYEYTQCLNQFKSLIKEQQLIKQNRHEDSLTSYSLTLKNLLKEDEKEKQELSDLTTQKLELDIYLKSESFAKRFANMTKEDRYLKSSSFLLEQFPLLSEEYVLTKLKDFKIYSIYRYSFNVQIPIFLGTYFLAALIFYFMNISLGWWWILLTIGVGLVSDLVAGYLYKSKRGEYVYKDN